MEILIIFLVIFLNFLYYPSYCGRSTDSNLIALWNFQSTKTGEEFFVSPSFQGTVNGHDEICCDDVIETKNEIINERFPGEKSVSVVFASDEGIQAFEGNRLLKVSVINNEKVYEDWCKNLCNWCMPNCEYGNPMRTARSDPSIPWGTGNFLPAYEDEVWYGFAILVPGADQFLFEEKTCESLGEFQASNAGGGGQYSVNICKDELSFSANFVPEVGSTIKRGVKYQIIRNQWHRIVVNLKHSIHDTGFVKVWVDDQKIMDYQDVSIGQDIGKEDITSWLDIATMYKYSWWGNPYHDSSITPEMQLVRTLYYDSIRVAHINEGDYNMVVPIQDGGEPSCFGKINDENACHHDDGHGSCISNNVCSCIVDWQGLECEIPVCNQICNDHQYCSNPDVCSCLNGWNGNDCEDAECSPICTGNFECTAPNLCNCIDGFTGVDCDIPEGTCVNPTCNSNQECSNTNVCICINGWIGDECDKAVCTPKCNENQNCSSPNTCTCLIGWAGVDCASRDCRGNFGGYKCRECLYGWGGNECQSFLSDPGYKWILPFSLSIGITLLIIIIVLIVGCVIYVKTKKRPKAMSNIQLECDNLSTVFYSEIDEGSKSETLLDK